MNKGAAAVRTARPALSKAWHAPLRVYAALVSGLLLVFHRDLFALFDQWNQSTFNHCWLILPMFGWLIARRRETLATLEPAASTKGLVWVAAAGLLWLAGELAGVQLLRHAALVAMPVALVPALFGTQVTRALLFPLAFALFMIPIGEELVPTMQRVTAELIMPMLHVSGIPAALDGIFITTPRGYFAVAEACSGVKFLVAIAALSTFAAHLWFRRRSRQFAFVAFALLVGIIANAVRAWGTIVMAETWGTRFAVGADHLIYGWVFFAIVMALVAWGARPFVERSPDDADAPPPEALARFAPRVGGHLTGVAVAAALALIVPVAFGLNSAARSLPIALVSAPIVPGWELLPDDVGAADNWRAHYAGATQRRDWHYRDAAGRIVTVTLAAYARQSEGAEIAGFGQGAVAPDGDWRWGGNLRPIGPMAVEQIVREAAVRDVARLYQVDGELTSDAARVKWATLRARAFRGDPRAWAVLVSAATTSDSSGRGVVASFIDAAGGAQALAERLTAGD